MVGWLLLDSTQSGNHFGRTEITAGEKKKNGHMSDKNQRADQSEIHLHPWNFPLHCQSGAKNARLGERLKHSFLLLVLHRDRQP